MVLHNGHHKVSQSVPFFMSNKTVTILLRIRVWGHFVMSITKYHKSHVTVLDNPRFNRTASFEHIKALVFKGKSKLVLSEV